MSVLDLNPRAVFDARIREAQLDGALTAAGILKFDHARIGNEKIGEWLSRIGHATIREETVLDWLERAGINPWRRGSQMSVHQRLKLAGILHDYVREARS